MVDYYSRWIEAILLKKTGAQHVIKCMEGIFRTDGLPETVRSDNGPPFASKEFQAFLEYLYIYSGTSWPVRVRHASAWMKDYVCS